MSQLEKLKALQSQSNTTNASLTLFNNVVVVNVGVNPTPHFPKLKDKFGNKVKKMRTAKINVLKLLTVSHIHL